MNYSTLRSSLLACTIVATRFGLMLPEAALMSPAAALAGQAPGAVSSPDIPISRRDRVYAAEQFSNTVSVTDPVDNKLLGVIRLGDPQPGISARSTRARCSSTAWASRPTTRRSPSSRSARIRSLSSTPPPTRSSTYLCRALAARGVLHAGRQGSLGHRARRELHLRHRRRELRGEDPHRGADGPGMQIFSPDGKYGYICSSFTPETVVVSVADHEIVARVKQESPFCPNIAATPDGEQVWFTLKDIGKTQVFNARPPFNPIKTIETGPITNHVNFARTAKGTFAYVTIGGTNEVKVFRTDDFSQVATIPVGKLPHGIWPSGDGTRIYVGLENADALAAIDTATNKVVANMPIGQAPQAIVYVPNAAPTRKTGRTCRPSASPARSLTSPSARGPKKRATSRRPASRCSIRA